MFAPGASLSSMREPFATTLYEGASGELGIMVPETTRTNPGISWQVTPTTHVCRTTRQQLVQFALLTSVSAKLLPYVLPQLTGAAAKDWWMAAYNADPDFAPDSIVEFTRTHQLTQLEDLW